MPISPVTLLLLSFCDFPLIFRAIFVTGGQEAVSSSLATRTKKPRNHCGFEVFCFVGDCKIFYET
uniref:Uncharacterized protein n=1 Tax=Siphoviridae sp. cty3u30 TaxID=2825744 RepID=A0A8S5Q804_9CAUD|nr:MAG TPA: hypothetical protein [Siphoviridae sp. cty3u30]